MLLVIIRGHKNKREKILMRLIQRSLSAKLIHQEESTEGTLLEEQLKLILMGNILLLVAVVQLDLKSSEKMVK